MNSSASTTSHVPRISNRKARFRYHILDSLEAGVSLLGTEVKSIRQGGCSLDQAFARLDHGECLLYDCHIAPYSFGNRMNHEPTRPRKLLLHRRELDRWAGKIKEQKLTLVPLTLYFVRGRVKVELALVRAKNAADKRESIKERDQRRETERGEN